MSNHIIVHNSNLPKQARKEAYESSDKESINKFVLSLLRGGQRADGLTPFELSDLTGWDITRSRPALSRLKAKCLVTVIKRKKDARSRTSVCVYVVTEEGNKYE